MPLLKYKKSEALKELEKEFHAQKKLSHPTVPEYALLTTKFSDDSANSLTASIMAFLKLKNCFGARVNTQGNYSQRLGKFITSGSTKGMPDISAIVKGRFVGIEVKFSKDVQSDRQKVIQQQIEEAGGLYYIARDFESFQAWYNENFNN